MRNKLYTKRIEICLTTDQKNKLEIWADREEKTVNQLIREILIEFLY